MKRQIFLNLSSNYLGRLIGLTLSVFLIPFLINKLGKETFGVVAVAESAILFFEIITISIRAALSRHSTFALARGDLKDFEKYLSTGRMILFCSAGLAMVTGAVIAYYFPSIFRVPAGTETHASILFLFIVATFAASEPNSVYWAVLYSHQRLDLINLCNSTALILRALLIFALFSWLPPAYINLATYGGVYMAVELSQNLFVFLWHRRLMPGLRIRAFAAEKDKVRPILSYAVHSSVTRLSVLLYDATATVLINWLWGPALNAVYSVALKWPSVLKRFFIQTGWTLGPTITTLASRGQKRELKSLFFLYTKIMTVVAAPLCLGLIFYARPLILLWVGPEFKESAAVLQVLALPLLFSIPFSACGTLNGAYARVKVPSRMSLLAAVSNVAAGLLLGKVLGMGILGIALGSVLCSMANLVFFTTFYACRSAGLSVTEYWGTAFLRPMAVPLGCTGAAYFLLSVAGRQREFSLWMAAAAGAGLALSWACGFLISITAAEKKSLMGGLRETLPGLLGGGPKPRVVAAP